MNFQQIYDAVVELTNQPQLVRETEQAILRSTLRMHSVDFFERDKFIQTINSAGGRIASIAISSFPLCRKIKDVRAFKQDGRNWQIKVGTEKDLFENRYCPNIAYNLGAILQVRASEDFNSLAVSYYAFPAATKESYKSWIAELYPYSIIDDAAATVLYLTGDNEQGSALAARVGTKDGRGRDTHIHTIMSEQLINDGSDIE
jgi:hypothetical protein